MYIRASEAAQRYGVCQPAQETEETRAPALGRVDPPGRVWQPSRILAWESPWTEEPGELQSTGSQGGGPD